MFGFINLEGEVIERTPYDYPYSYDEFVIYLNGYKKEKSHCVYSDRLFQWDSEKYNQCCLKVFGNTGQYFDNRKPSKINEFLNLYLEKEVKLTAICQGCNWSNGYPLWRFIYEEIE